MARLRLVLCCVVQIALSHDSLAARVGAAAEACASHPLPGPVANALAAQIFAQRHYEAPRFHYAHEAMLVVADPGTDSLLSLPVFNPSSIVGAPADRVIVRVRPGVSVLPTDGFAKELGSRPVVGTDPKPAGSLEEAEDLGSPFLLRQEGPDGVLVEHSLMIPYHAPHGQDIEVVARASGEESGASLTILVRHARKWEAQIRRTLELGAALIANIDGVRGLAGDAVIVSPAVDVATLRSRIESHPNLRAFSKEIACLRYISALH